jgi:ArsR family transcriptional regulator
MGCSLLCTRPVKQRTPGFAKLVEFLLGSILHQADMKRLHALPPEAALEMIAHYFVALADPMRIKIVHALMAGDQNVTTLVQVTGGMQSNVSRHLSKLLLAGVLNRRKQGTQVIYSIADPSLYDLCEQVCGSLEKRFAKQAKVIGVAARR